MRKKDIIKQIERKTGSLFYPSWTIGVTDNPPYRKSQHISIGEDVAAWEEWPSDSEKEGKSIEAFFVEKGMKRGGGEHTHASYVYIF